MLNRKCASGILVALLALNLSLLMVTAAMKPANAAEPDPWELPVVYLQAIPLSPTRLLVNLAVYNLTNTFYPSNFRWVEGGPLPPYGTGPVSRYYYGEGNLYGFDITFSWNPAVLQYVSRILTVPRTTAPQPFRSRGILNGPFMLAADIVDPVAGTCQIAYSSMSPAAIFNAEEDGANVVTMVFSVVGAGDFGLSLDSVDLVLDPRFWGRTPQIGGQPELPWRTVLDPDFTTNVGVDAAPRNKDVVGETKAFDTYALVKNTGTSSKTFDVTIYAGATQVGTASATVAANTAQTVKVTCTTTGLAKGSYVIKAQATVSGDQYAADNEVIQGTIFVTLAGDVDGDRDVDIFDIVTMAAGYGAANQAATNYNPYSDLDNSYTINIFDIVTAAGNYGKSWT
jgi:hypothetical protein